MQPTFQSTVSSDAPETGGVSNGGYGPWARRGWLVTTVLLAVVLVLNALSSFVGARRAVEGLNRGQADFLDVTLNEMLAAHGELSDSAVVARFFAGNQRRGLRYVALTAEGIHAGERASDAPDIVPRLAHDSAAERMPLLAVNDRLRAYFPAPARAPFATPQSGYIVIEFRPSASMRLMRSARRTLAIAVTAAVVLTLAALLFFRTSVRFEQTRLRLEQQRHLALLGEMSAVLAHEIRNPLAALKGHAQLAIERLTPGTREKTCVAYVIESAGRLEALTSDLLSFARTAPVELTPTDPVELMRAAVRDVFSDDPVPVHGPGTLPSWPLDAARVHQALVNLLQNAKQNSPEGTTPEVRVRLQSHQLLFEVRDFGSGLPPGRESRIFDPFFTTRANGTGLGLAIAGRVAELHGGAVTAHNHHDAGAVFRLSFPRAV
jgi:two-component system, NtrC family, sensor histidine kinase HydH